MRIISAPDVTEMEQRTHIGSNGPLHTLARATLSLLAARRADQQGVPSLQEAQLSPTATPPQATAQVEGAASLVDVMA